LEELLRLQRRMQDLQLRRRLAGHGA
jgi:hypothetical protein